jgi:endonuclease-3
MFYKSVMQSRFDFGRSDLDRWRRKLALLLADIELRPARRPASELVKAMISSRTRDADSLAAYERIVRWFGSPKRLACAQPAEIEPVIAGVTYPAIKAQWIASALSIIGRERPDFRLDFLGTLPLPDALAYLERLPGVRRKVSASVLNASTLRRPVFIVDTHVLRVLSRLHYVRPEAGYLEASEAVTADVPHWSAEALLLFHVATKRLGQRHCHHDMPDCRNCPLADECPGFRRFVTIGPKASI